MRRSTLVMESTHDITAFIAAFTASLTGAVEADLIRVGKRHSISPLVRDGATTTSYSPLPTRP